MKRSFFRIMTMLMVAIASVNLVSCGDDDDNKNNQNQNPNNDQISPDFSSVLTGGRWKYTDYDNGRVEGYDYYTFNDNGTGYSEEWNYYGEELRRDDADNFVYTYQNNRLTITEEDGDVEQYVVLSLTATQTQWREIKDSDIKTLVREQAK
ncbi:MAG: lipocalin family protein [Bacteroidaceae bacterium]|nr:lipocalin family protein [Bacteroidaceae bacterium]